MRAGRVLVGVACAVLGACGSSSSSSSPAPPQQTTGFFITIRNMAFSPLDLRVPPGATVTVVNDDGTTEHSVTSEAAANDFTPGGVSSVAFDTGAFTGTRSFSIPPTAATSTVVPYYCTVHTGTMTTPNGTITIDPTATATTAPGGTGTGGGGGGSGY
jgi:plastocyanin